MKKFFITLFVKQNTHHKHSVLIHILKVFYYSLYAGRRFALPALLHDIGKPFVATIDDDDYGYSFTNHEEKSYEIIKKWPFISEYTKNLVRYHYIKRRIAKDGKKLREGKNAYNGDLITAESVKELVDTYNSFSEEFKKDLRVFQILDDKGKGR